MNHSGEWQKFNDTLLAHGSWLYGNDSSRIAFDALFVPSSEPYKAMPVRQRMLIVKELMFCGVGSTTLESYLSSFTSLDEQTIQEIFESSSTPEFSSLDTQHPLNWFRGQEAGFFHDQNMCDAREGGPSYRMIIERLEVMTPQLFDRLVTQPDPLIRKRLVYLEHSLTRPTIRIFPNEDPVMNEVEDRLLKQIGSYPPDTRAGYGVVELLAEDIRSELDHEYRDKKSVLIRDLFGAIENSDVKALERFRSHFRNARVVPKGQRGAPDKKWLYGQVWDLTIRKELSKLRGVKFMLPPMPGVNY
ncbi:MAG: hypothetical protein WDA14_11675 [Sphaerochaetaceae bacterium]|jgi:hypothetical protein